MLLFSTVKFEKDENDNLSTIILKVKEGDKSIYKTIIHVYEYDDVVEEAIQSIEGVIKKYDKFNDLSLVIKMKDKVVNRRSIEYIYHGEESLLSTLESKISNILLYNREQVLLCIKGESRFLKINEVKEDVLNLIEQKFGADVKEKLLE